MSVVFPGSRGDESIRISAEVLEALSAQRPIVALESTVFSHLGLPSPANADALARCLHAVRLSGAVPAVTAVIDGVARVGLDESEHERILRARAKVAARDLPVAIGQRWDVGVTTVSASLALASRCRIAVFATGGIGGVHRGVEQTGDVSGDLTALSKHQVVTVCAGAKAFLDIGRTLEYLETVEVPVLSMGTDEFPAFTTRISGFRSPHRVEQPDEIARIALAAWNLGHHGGLLVAVPVPEADELPRATLDDAIARATAAADTAGVTGAAVTPFVLERIAELTDGASVPANLALAEQNAAVAADIACALADFLADAEELDLG